MKILLPNCVPSLYLHCIANSIELKSANHMTLGVTKLTDMETSIFNILLSMGITRKGEPTSSRDIDILFQKAGNNPLSLYSLKNSISSLRSKLKNLISMTAPELSDFKIIRNVNRKGYYISLPVTKEDFKTQVNTFKNITRKISTTKKLYISLSAILKLNSGRLIKAVITSIILSAIIIILTHAIQLLVIERSIKSKVDISSEIDSIIECCESHKMETHHADYQLKLRETQNIRNFIYLDKNNKSCKSNYYDDDLMLFSNIHSKNKISVLPNGNIAFKIDNKRKFFGEISGKDFKTRFEPILFGEMIQSIAIKTKENGYILTAGETKGGINIYTLPLYKYEGVSLVVFAHNPLWPLINLSLIILLFFFRSDIKRILFAFKTTQDMSLIAEPIIYRPTTEPVYYELLSRFTEKSPEYIFKKISDYDLELHVLYCQLLMLNMVKELKDIKFGLNLSPNSFNKTQLIDVLKITMHKNITIEITENHLGWSSKGIANLSKIKSMGYRIAIDDFGTGGNNIESLNLIGADYVKIDKEFISNVNKPSGYKLIKSIVETINSCNNSDVKIVAEGVETEDVSLTLLKLDITHQQGFLFKE